MSEASHASQAPQAREDRDAREDLAQALGASFGGSFHLSRSRALRHADFLLAAGYARPRYLTSQAETAQLGEGAVVERTTPGAPPEFFVRRSGRWHSVDGGAGLDDAALGSPGAWLAVRRG